MNVRRVWLVAAMLAVTGCGMAPAQKASPPSMAGGAEPPTGRPTDEIRQLDADITSRLAELGLAAPGDAEVQEMVQRQATPALPDGAAAEACEAPPPSACSDVCTLADSICQSARRICTLADELAGDDWAAGRCAAGSLSCERARSRCCDCASP